MNHIRRNRVASRALHRVTKAVRHTYIAVHVPKMVPTAGLEPAQVAPLAPQTSASTNFATSAFHGLAANFPRGSRSEPRKIAALRADQKTLSLTDHFGGVAGAGAVGAAGAGAAGAGAGAFSIERSNTLVGSPAVRVPK